MKPIIKQVNIKVVMLCIFTQERLMLNLKVLYEYFEKFNWFLCYCAGLFCLVLVVLNSVFTLLAGPMGSMGMNMGMDGQWHYM